MHGGHLVVFCSRFRWPGSLFEVGMVRFNKVNKATPSSASTGAQASPLQDLGELMRMSTLPLGGVSTVGRVVYIFGHSGSLHAFLWCVEEGWGVGWLGNACRVFVRLQMNATYCWGVGGRRLED